MLRPLYLVCGRKIRPSGRDRPAPALVHQSREDREEVERSSRLPFREESPNSCLGPFVKSLRGARICKDGPNGKGGGNSIGPHDDG
jgi:hypothetical protein